MRSLSIEALQGSKFRRRSLNIVRPLLAGLRDGLYPSKIARQLGLRKNHIHYYIKKLKGLGFIEKRNSIIQGQVRTRGAITVYQVTEDGSKFLAEIEKGVLNRKLRLHNCYWLYPIVQQPEIEINWRRVELHNWGQLIGRELGLKVRKNPNSVEIVTNTLYGDDSYALLFRSRDEADMLASHIEQKFHMKLGRPRLSHKPHFAIYDPMVNEWSKNLQLDTKHGKIDRSMGYGEIDLTDPGSAANYLEMPNRLERIEKGMGAFAEGMDEHMLLISELRGAAQASMEVVNALSDVVKKVEKILASMLLNSE